MTKEDFISAKAIYTVKLTCLAIFFLFWSFVSFGQDATPSFEWTEAQKRYQSENGLERYSQAAAKWHKDIVALKSKNASEGDPDSIVLLGSSSIRLWSTADRDLAPLKIVRRGYGGAKYCDLAIHAESLLDGLKYKAAMVFVGNDITGDQLDKTPDEIARLASLVIATIRKVQPNVPVFLIAVTPTPKRYEHWQKIIQANASLEQLCLSGEGLTFIKTADRYLDEEGKPRSELFLKDNLHQNDDGYKLWASILKASLDTKLTAK